MIECTAILVIALLAVAEYGWFDEQRNPPRPTTQPKDGLYQI
jgi:hypothetical protein